MAAAIAPVFEETSWLCLFAKYPLYIDEKCDIDAISLTCNKVKCGPTYLSTALDNDFQNQLTAVKTISYLPDVAYDVVGPHTSGIYLMWPTTS